MDNILVFLHSLEHDRTGLTRSLRSSEEALRALGIECVWIGCRDAKSFAELVKCAFTAKWVLFNGLVTLMHPLNALARYFWRFAERNGLQTFLYWHETEWGLANCCRAWPKRTRSVLKQMKASSLRHLVTSQRAAQFVNTSVAIPEPRIDLVYECARHRTRVPPSKGLFKNGVNRIPSVVSAASIQPRKGTDIFIDVAKKVLETGMNVRFMWVGSANESDLEYAELCQRSVIEAGFEHNIIFTGYLDSPDSLIEEANLFLMTSRDDPLPISSLEAMSFGKTIICFDIGGLPEALAGTGHVIPEISAKDMADLVVRLLTGTHSSLHSEAAKARYLAEFTPERFAHRLARILRDSNA